MNKANIVIISLFLSVSILPSVVRADMVTTGSSPAEFLIIIAAIIGTIALIAWRVIKKIKKYDDSDSSEREPEIRA